MPENHEEGEHAPPEKALEIDLGNLGGNEPSDPRAQQLRSWANIIATTAALVTAAAAMAKPQDQTVNRATYEQLKEAIEKTNADVKQNHDDQVAMHSYLTGYFAGNANFVLPPMDSATPTASTSAAAFDAGVPTIHINPRPHPTANSTVSVSVQPPMSYTSYTAYAPAAPVPIIAYTPPPAVHDQAMSVPLPTFDTVASPKK